MNVKCNYSLNNFEAFETTLKNFIVKYEKFNYHLKKWNNATIDIVIHKYDKNQHFISYFLIVFNDVSLY